MNNNMQKMLIGGISIAGISFLNPQLAQAVTVSPQGVNVSTFSPTTTFLTYFNVNGLAPAEAQWCGAINADGSCVPGTVFGRLPRRYNLGRFSNNVRQGVNNYTDIMSIPTSITRKAYQDALRGNQADFFYVRRFVSTTGGIDEYVAVTCRLSSSGAGVPLSITNVKYQLTEGNASAVKLQTSPIGIGTSIPKFGAMVNYTGTGRLKGRWEVVLPGEPTPTPQDLLTEASLPLEQRGFQRRYTQLQRFDLYLQPSGSVFIPGPDPASVPRGSTGLHQFLLRIEATDNPDGSFNIPSIAPTGGVAGFPIPIFRYMIVAKPTQIALQQPNPDEQLLSKQQLRFSWEGVEGASGYKLQIKQSGKLVLSALLSKTTVFYVAPPWLRQTKGVLSWQVQALKSDGSVLQESETRSLTIN
jgi:hypothetical protein